MLLLYSNVKELLWVEWLKIFKDTCLRTSE
jgi:hypothetical protein